MKALVAFGGLEAPFVLGLCPADTAAGKRSREAVCRWGSRDALGAFNLGGNWSSLSCTLHGLGMFPTHQKGCFSGYHAPLQAEKPRPSVMQGPGSRHTPLFEAARPAGAGPAGNKGSASPTPPLLGVKLDGISSCTAEMFQSWRERAGQAPSAINYAPRTSLSQLQIPLYHGKHFPVGIGDPFLPSSFSIQDWGWGVRVVHTSRLSLCLRK